MIELLLQAERALTAGMTDQAERLYWQAVEADPHNAIAVTGLARVALEHADDRTSYVFARKALAIDPDNPAAQRLVARLEEVMAYRGEAVPVVNATDPMPAAMGAIGPAAEPGEPAVAEPGEPSVASAAQSALAIPGEQAVDERTAHDRPRGLIDRLLHRGQ